MIQSKSFFLFNNFNGFRRSIELSFTFLDNQDAVAIVESLMGNLDKYSDEMKRFATGFIVSAIEKNSPSKDWMIDQFLKLMQHVTN